MQVHRGVSGRRIARRAGAVLVVAAAAAAGYAAFVEPYLIEATHHSIPAAVEQPLRIAHLADLHLRGFGVRERGLRALLEREAYDLMVLTGDLTEDGRPEAVRALLGGLKPPLGIWLVRGDRERAHPLPDEAALWASLGVQVLANRGTPVREDVWLAGLDDERPDADAALGAAPMGAFKIVLFHAPRLFDALAGRVNLALAGHTHGGQVQLPGLGPLGGPEAGAPYVDGWYMRNSSQLYVTRGVGTSGVPARLGCRPELALIELRPQ